MNREQLLAFHESLTGEALELMKRKNHDYAGTGGDDPFANFRRCEAMGICSTERGFMVRIVDKLSRLSTFSENGKLLVQNEGVSDTCLDLINYAVLFAAWVHQQRELAAGNSNKQETVAGLAIANEREAIAEFIDTHKGVWGKNAAEMIRRGEHIRR